MISVCIATFNGEKFLKQQVESILPQLGANDEVIISDDSSTDSTVRILKNFNDRRLCIFEGQNFRSPIFNFEFAIKKAKGDFVFLSDQDDIWHSDKVERMVAALKNHSMVVSDCKVIGDDNKIIFKSFYASRKSGKGLLKNLYKNTYLGCCMAFRREILIMALPFPKYIPMHDMWLGFVCELFYSSVFIKDRLTYYRKHNDNNTSSSLNVRNKKLSAKLLFRINLVRYLPNLLFRGFRVMLQLKFFNT